MRIYGRHVYVPKKVYRTAEKLVSRYAQSNPTRKKGEHWCSACGGKFEGTEERCPHCGARFALSFDDKCRLVYKTEYYLREITTYGEWQVVKEYVADIEHRSGSEAKADIYLVYSWWYKPSEGATLLYGSYIGMGANWRRIPFSRHGALHFINSKVGEGSYWYSDWMDHLVPNPRILDYYKVHGLGDESLAKPFLEQKLAAYTANGTILETLVKTGQAEAAKLFIRDTRFRTRLTENWRSWCIARRHGMDIDGIGMVNYLDYLYELKVLKKDRRNPFFICPKDFFAAHSATSMKVARILEARAEKAQSTRRARDIAYQAQLAAERARKMKAAGPAYKRRIARYAALVITDGAITIRPLMTVGEFKEEGEAMCHCVFSNAYYSKTDSLILSARDKDGERLETVEVDLKDWRVAQSRAYRNGMSSYHDEIVSLVTEAMPRIKELSKKTKLKQIA